MGEWGASRPVLAGRISLEYLRVRRLLHRTPLREVVAGPRVGAHGRQPPTRLSRAVTLVLGRLAGDRARCIHRAVVLQRLLARQGDAAVLVVGLPHAATSERAHAWVEIHGIDVGPAPGRGGHVEMARYDGSS